MAALLTRVEVDPHDPAFSFPSKPIGPLYDREEAQRLATERGWSIGKDGEHFRRVVASPMPRRILELRTIELLLKGGHIVVCAGGGGIPVVAAAGNSMHGVEAVVDKDFTASHVGGRTEFRPSNIIDGRLGRLLRVAGPPWHAYEASLAPQLPIDDL